MESIKDIQNHASLFETMKEEGFFLYPEEQFETFMEHLNKGETWYSNGIVQFKIIRSFFGDRIFNFRFTNHRTMIKLFNAA